MKPVRVFDEQEWGLVRECLALVCQAGAAQARRASSGLQVLLHLAQAISHCPPLLRRQELGGTERSAATLRRLLCRQAGRNDMLNLPTKAVLGRSFQVAKINYLFLLRHLLRSIPEAGGRERACTELILLNVLTLMSEELFFAILQDERIEERVRERAASRLADLWEHRLRRQARDLAPVLYSLWNVRGELPPLYGTLSGVSELLRLSQRVHPLWVQFLRAHGREAAAALEEFLFDLSHEQIQRVRQAMAENGVGAVDADWLDGLGLRGGDAAQGPPPEPDPRELYRFFRRRRREATARRRAGLPGPHRTIEEMLLCYLLSGGGQESPSRQPAGRQRSGRAEGGGAG